MSQSSRHYEQHVEMEEQEEIRMEQSVKVIGIDELLADLGLKRFETGDKR